MLQLSVARRMHQRRSTHALEATIVAVLKRELGKYGFVNAKIKFRKDHDGEEAIFIDAKYEPRDIRLDSRATARARDMLRSALLSIDEQRFPYIRHILSPEGPDLNNK